MFDKHKSNKDNTRHRVLIVHNRTVVIATVEQSSLLVKFYWRNFRTGARGKYESVFLLDSIMPRLPFIKQFTNETLPLVANYKEYKIDTWYKYVKFPRLMRQKLLWLYGKYVSMMSDTQRTLWRKFLHYQRTLDQRRPKVRKPEYNSHLSVSEKVPATFTWVSINSNEIIMNDILSDSTGWITIAYLKMFHDTVDSVTWSPMDIHRFDTTNWMGFLDCILCKKYHLVKKWKVYASDGLDLLIKTIAATPPEILSRMQSQPTQFEKRWLLVSPESLQNIIMPRHDDIVKTMKRAKRTLHLTSWRCVQSMNTVALYIRDYIVYRPTHQRHSLARLFEEARKWHEETLTTEQQKYLDRYGSDPFPAPPTFDLPSEFRFLSSPLELLEEGTKMGHCVASYSSYCARGNSFIYSVVKDNESATVEISSRGHVSQSRGPRNIANKASMWAERIAKKAVAKHVKENPEHYKPFHDYGEF